MKCGSFFRLAELHELQTAGFIFLQGSCSCQTVIVEHQQQQ